MDAQTGCYTGLSVLRARGAWAGGISSCIALFSTSADMFFSHLPPTLCFAGDEAAQPSLRRVFRG